MKLHRRISQLALATLAFCTTAFAAPSNDHFAKAIPLSGDSGTVLGTTLTATRERGEDEFFSSTVWWRWTAPESAYVSLDVLYAGGDLDLGVYRGTKVNSLQRVDFGRTFRAEATKTYFFRAGAVGEEGEFSFTYTATPLPSAPLNDTLAKAALLTGNSGAITGTTEGASLERGESNDSDNPDVASVWFRWIAPADGYFQLTDSGASTNTQVTREKNVPPLFESGNRRTYSVKAGELLHIRVASTFLDESAFSLPFQFGTSALVWSYPRRVKENAGTVVVELRRLGATDSTVTAGFRTFAGSELFTSSFDDPRPTTATAGEDYTATSSMLSFAPGELLKTIPIPLLSDSTSEIEEWIDFELTNVVGAVVFDTHSNYREFVLLDDVQDDPANDNFDSPITLTGTSGDVTAARGTSGSQDGDTGDDFSMWYQWTAPSDGILTITEYYGGARFRLFTGTALDALTENAPIRDEYSNKFPVTAGTTYRLVVVESFGNLAHNLDYDQYTRSLDFFYSFDVETSFQLAQGPHVVQEKAGSITIPIFRHGDASNSADVFISYFTDYIPFSDDSSDSNYNSPLASLSDGYARVRGGDSSGDSSVDYRPRVATEGRDYLSQVSQIMFAAGERQKNLVIPIVKDGVKEKTEFFSAALQNDFASTLIAITENGLFKTATYYGAVENADGLYAHGGVFTLKLASTGSYTGKVQMGTLSIPFKGMFDSATAEATLSLGGHTLVLRAPRLLDPTGTITPNIVTGTVSNGTATSTISALRVSQKDRFFAFPPAAKFHVAMPGSLAPGIATFDISKKGTGTLKGLLPDGTKFTGSAPISFHGTPTETFDFSTPLYRDTGGILGRVTNLNRAAFAFFGAASGDGDGGFSWHHSAQSKGPILPVFDAALGAVISKHTGAPFPAGEYECRISGEASVILTRSVTIGAKNMLTYSAGAESLKLKLDKNGALTGSFVHNGKPAKIHAITLRNIREIHGFFTTLDSVGKVELVPQ